MKARVIAYYLPQFHPIPENDEAWGPGFTEWTNVAKAKPLFRGHYQPRIPADLGFYDLRLPEVREKQADLAREAGIEGFCYWHYWFGNGKLLLQRPFEEVLHSGKPDFPFCLTWANHDWTTNTWQSEGKNKIIAKQLYPGDKDYIAHFNYCLPAFRDSRYITVDDKPLFGIYDPYNFPDVSHFIQVWRQLAAQNGLGDIFFVALCKPTTTKQRMADGTIKRVLPNLKSSAEVYKRLLQLGFDALNPDGRPLAEMKYQGKYLRLTLATLQKYCPWLPPLRYDYAKVMPYYYAPEDAWENIFPTLMPQWDRSARSGAKDGIYVNATPKNFKKHIEQAIKLISHKADEHKVLFLRSWNEWAEGNYVEPDTKYGHGFLDALKQAII
jgi:lipopolysaccharide biosynthesis protein